MAKMFYTLKETADKLGVNETEIKQMASDGALQQFRDGNKLMFKRDQVESISEEKAADETEVSLEKSHGPIPTASSGDTDQIDLSETGADTAMVGDSGQSSGTGISIFNADEVEPADPLAKTQMAKPSDKDGLELESVASGSGLMDLTQKSDDTSLGAELLEEIYPGSDKADSKIDSLAGSASATSIGPFETGMGLEASAMSATGIAMDGVDMATTANSNLAAVMAYEEPYDAAADGLSIGLLFGAIIALIIALSVGISAHFGVTSGITAVFTSNFWMYVGILLGGSIVLGLIGQVVGKKLLK